jgi:tRNA nucleotidyltransferase (CCA-adding enzyme)
LLIEANQLWMNVEKTKKLKPSQVCRLLDSYSLLAIYCVSSFTNDFEIRDILGNYALQWRKQKPFTTGTDLKNKGVIPGPHYREILEHLRYAWVDGKIKTREQEKKELNRLLKKYPGETMPDHR